MMYQIRPYTFQFLNAIQPFYEIVAISNIDIKKIEIILDHLETVLNEQTIHNNKKMKKKLKEYKDNIKINNKRQDFRSPQE